MTELPDLSSWLGREEHSADVLCPALTARLAALLDRSDGAWETGRPIASHWYVQLFGAVAPQSTLGPDGHPPKGDLLPPVPWPRRMFGGRRVEFSGDLRIGDEVERTSRVTAITPKTGRSGPLCFVTLRHELATARGPAVVEEQDIVYRPAADSRETPSRPADAAPTAMPQPTASRSVLPDPPMLFRYSALMNNAHRIHYDVTYARETEGFADLVVNGGLTTLLLWELAIETTGGAIRRSSSRNLKPLFVNKPMHLHVAPGAAGNGHLVAWATDDTGAVAIQAELEVSR